MKLRTISTLVALSLAISLGTYVTESQAQTNSTFSETNTTLLSQQPSEAPPYRGKRNRGRGWERMLQQLDLTSEQTEKIDAIRAESRQEYEALREEMRDSHQQMRSLLSSDASSNELRQQHRAMQRLRQKMSDRRFETMLEIREVLTPEQREQIVQLIKNNRGNRGFRRFN